MSSQIRNPTHPPKSSDPAREPADPMSATGLSSLNPKTTGLLAGLMLRNQNLTKPTVFDKKIAHFLSNMLRSDLNSKSQARSHRDPARSRQDRPKLFEIRWDLVKIQSGLSRSGGFWQNPAAFHTTWNRSRTNLNPVKI